MTTTLTKIVEEKYVIQDINPEDGMKFDFTKFKETRVRFGLGLSKKELTCLKCDKEFKDGDRMYLIITDKGNYFTCKECARKLRAEMGVDEYCKPENQHLNKVKI